MTNRFQLPLPKNIGFVALAFFSLASLFGIGFYIGNASGLNEAQAEIAAGEIVRESQIRLGNCVAALPRDKIANCIRDVQLASRADQRAEYDLAAQRDMADWAWWVMIIGILQFFATVVTVAFIKLTLDATLKAVADTSEATSAMHKANSLAERNFTTQLRPWITARGAAVVIGNLVELDGVVEDVALCFYSSWQNTGQTPAIDCDIYQEFRLISLGSPVSEFSIQGTPGKYTFAPGAIVDGPNLAMTSVATHQWLAKELELILFAHVSYSESLDSEKTRFTNATFSIIFDGYTIDQNGNKRIKTSIRPVGPQNGMS